MPLTSDKQRYMYTFNNLMFTKKHLLTGPENFLYTAILPVTYKIRDIA